jgi:phosphoribosyl-ATP pyrophosphohydrolase
MTKSGSDILARLFEVIEDRKRERPDGSYVVDLLDAGVPGIAAKIREEADELIEAAGNDDQTHTANEAADLIFHVWVLLGHAGLHPDRVFEVLEERFGMGGREEKASRKSHPD